MMYYQFQTLYRLVELNMTEPY